MNPLRIGTRAIGTGEPVYVIAEAGVNHDGAAAVAHRLVDVAREVGADAVKFQAFDPDALAAAGSATAAYQRDTTGVSDQRDLLSALVLAEPVWGELAEHAATVGLDFLCTPFDRASADLLTDVGVPAFKVSSGDLDNLPFLRDLAARGKPVLLSSGMATLDEVGAAVAAVAGAPGVGVFHCVSSYPAPVADANLRAITTMRDALDVAVGWSDHTIGTVTAIAAVALGAVMVEKHLTLDRSRPGPDHAASADPPTFAALVAGVRECRAALGDGVKAPRAVEAENRALVRRSWHVTRAVAAGERVAPAAALLRPATGLPPATDIGQMVAKRAIPAGSPLTVADVVPMEK